MARKEPEPFLTLGFAGISWMEHYLVHGPGDVQGQRLELDDEFAAFVLKAYQIDARGNRKVRRAFFSRPKGRSKSGLAAELCCFEALGPCRFDHFAADGEVSPWGYEYSAGEPVGRPLTYAEVLCVATEEGQAGNTYDAVHYVLDPETCSPELLADYGKIDVGLTRTNLPGKRGFIEPVTSADGSADGGKSTFIVADETHLWILPRLKRLHQVMTRNLLKRKIASGWMLETSTMYSEGEQSVAEGTHAYAKRVAAGRKNDRTLLFDHRQAGDNWTLSVRSDRLKALREVYGPAASWMNLDAICDSWDDPQTSEAEFRRYWLNQPVPLIAPPPADSLVDFAKWANLEDPTRMIERVRAFGVEVKVDRSTGHIAAAGPAGTDVAVELLDWSRVPKPRPYGLQWLVARCVELNASHGPAQFVVDGGGPARSEIAALQQAGLQVTVVGLPEITAATATFVDAVAAGTVVHGPQGDLDAIVQQAVKRPLGDGGYAISRKKSPIDVTPLIAVTLAHWAARTRSAPEVYSIRELMEQIQAERAAEAEVQTDSPVQPAPETRPDGSIFVTT